MYKKTIAMLVAALYLSIAQRALSADSSYADAIKLFNEKKYGQSLPMFKSVFTKDPKNVAACLYAAHACYYMRDFAGAKALYIYVTKNFPNTNESAHAAIMLSRISDSDLAQSVTAVTTAASAAVEAQQKKATAAVTGADLAKTLVVVRPQGDHQPVSAALISNVREWITHLPKPIVALLAEGKIKFYVTPTLIDLHPEMANTEGAGYDGATLKQCPGMFESRQERMIICERVVSDADNSISPAISMDNINDTFFHELGHAVDFCMNWVSYTSEFVHVYRFDEANIHRGDTGTEARMAYFLQKAQRGPTEACGEIIGVLLGIKRHAADTEQAFPNTIAFLKKKLQLN